MINGVSNNFQKLLRYFTGTTTFMFFTERFVSLTTVFAIRAVLYSNGLELSAVKSALLFGTSSLLNCHKLPDVSE